MWAIVEINKKQYLVEAGQTIGVERLPQKEGEIVLDKICLLADDKNVSVGTPYVAAAKIKAQVLGEKKGIKVLSYKYRKRKKSRRRRGHRQINTLLKIIEITPSK